MPSLHPPRKMKITSIGKDAEKLEISYSYANQNYNDVSPHIGQIGHHQKFYKQILERVWGKGSPSALLVGM